MPDFCSNPTCAWHCIQFSRIVKLNFLSKVHIKYFCLFLLSIRLLQVISDYKRRHRKMVYALYISIEVTSYNITIYQVTDRHSVGTNYRIEIERAAHAKWMKKINPGDIKLNNETIGTHFIASICDFSCFQKLKEKPHITNCMFDSCCFWLIEFLCDLSSPQFHFHKLFIFLLCIVWHDITSIFNNILHTWFTYMI